MLTGQRRVRWRLWSAL